MNKSIWLARLLYRHKEGLTKQEILNAWAEEDDHGRPMATTLSTITAAISKHASACALNAETDATD